ncbi:hypothetical protein NDU88_005293 [Pleurodeles waltl]|uniref:Uncharacterized protein n=1 Tax=Pleurodeles waltl TaxID=8319 RepID=A0AAV7LKQ9_PLEWA|nr:hypothetical protein NDU88_005293 [Pleurodeles waltl]
MGIWYPAHVTLTPVSQQSCSDDVLLHRVVEQHAVRGTSSCSHHVAGCGQWHRYVLLGTIEEQSSPLGICLKSEEAHRGFASSCFNATVVIFASIRF